MTDTDNDVRDVLTQLQTKVAARDDGSLYGARNTALDDIDLLLRNPSKDGVRYLLLPTAHLHELSLENGWGDDFNELAARLEAALGIA